MSKTIEAIGEREGYVNRRLDLLSAYLEEGCIAVALDLIKDIKKDVKLNERELMRYRRKQLEGSKYKLI